MGTRLLEYGSHTFLQKIMLHGIRFVWPYSYVDLVIHQTHNDTSRFSEEFKMRVENLRSFTVAKDFLDMHPEFRGEMPQLEPSLTAYRLAQDQNVNRTYWAQLRRKRQGKNN